MKLKDKISIVTGAGRGIGEAIAVRYGKEGSKVVVSENGLLALLFLNCYMRRYHEK